MLPTPELEISRNLPPLGCSVAQAERYTRWLATHHYENFGVVSWLLPRGLHQHFYNVYAYCRWSDDIGDEIQDPARSLELFRAWEEDLRHCWRHGEQPLHPVFIALRETVREKHTPLKLYIDLLRAFRQDQKVHRYATWDAVLNYCVYSATPVGRLVLHLCGYQDEQRQKLSDYTCTALQLANFWQDVGRDLEKDRIYIPLEELTKHGLSEDDIVARRFDKRYVALMQTLIARTREMFGNGLPLADRVGRHLRSDIELFRRGGIAILNAIEASGYNTLSRRPALSKWTKASILARARGTRALARKAGRTSPPVSADDSLSTNSAPAVSPVAASVASVPAKALSVAASYAECHRTAAQSHSSFYLAFFGLRKEKRNALCALYAFMRLVDDVSDDQGDIESKRVGLARWRGVLDGAGAGATGGHQI